MTFTEGMTVRQIKGADEGAIGTITRIIEPTHFYSDGSAGDGRIHVTFKDIRYPSVRYNYGSAERFIKKIDVV